MSTFLDLTKENEKKPSSEPSNLSSNISVLRTIQCSICLEMPENISATPCGHLFCYTCIHRVLLNGSVTCPICRKKISRQRILALELMLQPENLENPK